MAKRWASAELTAFQILSTRICVARKRSPDLPHRADLIQDYPRSDFRRPHNIQAYPQSILSSVNRPTVRSLPYPSLLVPWPRHLSTPGGSCHPDPISCRTEGTQRAHTCRVDNSSQAHWAPRFQLLQLVACAPVRWLFGASGWKLWRRFRPAPRALSDRSSYTTV